MEPIFLIGAYALAAAIACGGNRARALTASGAVAACVVGGTIFGFGGLAWAGLLILFFVSSSALSFVKSEDERKRRAAVIFEKGGRRDAAQVLANGGVAAAMALLWGLGAGPATFYAFVGSLAAATADTWATEIGVLSKDEPRLITTGRRVQPGTSGAVTLLGSSASLGGALAMGLAAMVAVDAGWVHGVPAGLWATVAAGLAGGVAGSMFDSLLGATVQAGYWCPACGVAAEGRVHRCGTATQLMRGVPAIDNDVVNLLATVMGAVVGWVVGIALAGM